MNQNVGQIFNLSKAIRRRSFQVRRSRCGFTLLEVMLAMSILVGALAVMGEYGRLGLRNAKTARDLTRAELLCESVMSQITAGILSTDSVQNQSIVDPVTSLPISDQNDDSIGWVYSVETQTVDEDGLISVTVTVQQDLSSGVQPVSYSLVRWMPDPYASSTPESDSSGSDSSMSSSSDSTTTTGQ
jgi:prepilin-type N-terminal cleavage/methylation domain-containing protein